MSNASVAVCVAVDDGQSVEDAVAAALAPYDMADDPDGRWDRWRISGWRAPGPLPVRVGCEDDPRVLRVSKPPEEWDPGRCDGAPRGLLDFTADRAASRRQAEHQWAEWSEVASRYPVGQPLRDFLLRHLTDKAGYPMSAADRDYLDQPVMHAYMARYDLDPDRMIWHEYNDPIGRFGYDADAYVRRQVARAVPPDELLRLDGVWVYYAQFGTDLLDVDRWDLYYAAADAYLDALPAEAYIVRVQFHS
ncbi:hypothetical protein [Dactylosporangium matsuzakiense]|uniref:Uncharacterized protein n=1 Tax=Dactylosporangium matsuzakiense TaxID=53360 RepID=A0A9W6NRQ3_9ACTN|nr:hypothetical protein [Dactylosporangium matsuzakiense]GLL07540.1 hypothetical protein GCM10017581_092940 [Dactylosporangium matsuzakiense]